MIIRFWGVRGSIPAPLGPEQIQSKIAAVVAQISARDIVSEDSRQRFLAQLSPSLYGTIGGNTSCTDLQTSEGQRIIFDAGTGIRSCGEKCANIPNAVYHLIFSHFHWDHIQGLPFFAPLYRQDSTVHIYSPCPDMQQFLKNQMEPPYFPVSMSSFTKNIRYHLITPLEPFFIGGTEVLCKKMFHPGSSHSYLLTENNKRFIYATDVELQTSDFEPTAENIRFFADADVLVLDSQYTMEDAVEKETWGHSAFSYAVDFAVLWNIKRLYLFHHEPTYNDKKIYSIFKSAQGYAEYVSGGKLSVHLAIEGQEISL